ncbi:tyrosine protein phosphatase [Halalkalibacillus sediminis]|uniref:Tyrosine-protein phosphatase n=1 Tax=Halalkalibacillus sediminis TaxID=2018042 RepID=A0A2I0QUQ3_9BACI|nr:CpsB/CapC family capsule biosynthesis tyrosine phosphatase [Halalkalibacillus sediminis]PKR77820.1 tyrosine protein phosphatase [Halalkalibacillus sediminis]
MIDIHNHLLPNIDDGPSSLYESLSLATDAVNMGINTVYVTPHHLNPQFENPKDKILKEIEMFQIHLENEQIPLTVRPGQEVRIVGDLIERIDRDEILFLNNKSSYLLLEFPSNNVPRFTSKIVFELQVNNHRPIIAHPERNKDIIQDPSKLYQLVKNGALTQLTASSVCGYAGKKIQKFCFKLIESNLAHFIASDAHNSNSRSFNLPEAYSLIEQKFGMYKKEELIENANLLHNSELVVGNIPEKVASNKFFNLF